MRSLGWPVELATHREFAGGLSRATLADGPFAPYFATPTREMIFHATAQMPATATGGHDLKKRLLAGDEIQVVWSEDSTQAPPM